MHATHLQNLQNLQKAYVLATTLSDTVLFRRYVPAYDLRVAGQQSTLVGLEIQISTKPFAVLRAVNLMSRGRKTLLDAQLQRKICALLSKGSAIKSACIICGVGERTFYDWRDRGKAGEEPFARFFSAVTRAREQHKANLIERIVAAIEADWKSAAWLLERQFPADFSRPEQREIIIERPPPPAVQLQSPEVRTETRWTKDEIPFSKAQLKYLSDLSITDDGGHADGK